MNDIVIEDLQNTGVDVGINPTEIMVPFLLKLKLPYYGQKNNIGKELEVIY